MPGPYTWPWSSSPSVNDLGQSLGLDLSVSLPKAVRDASDGSGGGRVEYGLVERAFALAEPDDWAVLLAAYDHRWYWRDRADLSRATLPYTASRYLAGRLGVLGERQQLTYSDGRGTGYWSYLRHVSHWTLPDRVAVPVTGSFGQQDVGMTDYMPALRPKG